MFILLLSWHYTCQWNHLYLRHAVIQTSNVNIWFSLRELHMFVFLREWKLLKRKYKVMLQYFLPKVDFSLEMKSFFFSFLPRGPMQPPPKKEMMPMPKRPDEWKDPWRRSKSPRRRPGLMGSPPRGRRRHRPSGSSVSLSNSSRYWHL